MADILNALTPLESNVLYSILHLEADPKVRLVTKDFLANYMFKNKYLKVNDQGILNPILAMLVREGLIFISEKPEFIGARDSHSKYYD
jgi:hypothetical protein